MKVFVVNPSLFTPFYDHYFCHALIGAGDDVTIVGRPLRHHENPEYAGFRFADLFYRNASRREGRGAPTKIDRILKGLEHFSGLNSLVKLVESEQPDIVHFQWLVVPLLDRHAIARLRRHCGLVLTVHNSDLVAHDTGTAVGHFGAFLQSIGQKHAILGFDRYIVHSLKAQRHLVELGVRPSDIVHLPHPMLPLDVPPAAATFAPVCGLRSILFFGNIKPYKGLETLVDAGISLASTRRDFQIIVAGRPSYSLDSLRARIDSAGATSSFHFDLQYVSDAKLAQYLSAASITVFPYREIDGSGAISHAIGFNLPIIASDVGGFSEPPFREHIELVPPGDSAALANAIRRLLDEPSRLEEAALRTKALRLSLPTWDEFAHACRDAYGDILAERTV